LKGSKDSKQGETKISREEMDRVVAQARKAGEDRMKGYREQSLRIHPWICARCGMEFTHRNLHMLTVHHRDHDHDNNPGDGSNWENLCIYCHDNEHRRYLDLLEGDAGRTSKDTSKPVTHRPFAGLADLLKK
jgi:hypothetical protein